MEKTKGSTSAPKNAVHQNSILVETVRKEEQNQRLFESYSVPRKHLMCVTGKPNVAEAAFGELPTELQKTQERPRPAVPLTSAQEYGWYNSLATGDKSGEFYKGRQQTEITDYMDAFWRQKEQASLGGKAEGAQGAQTTKK